MPRLVNGETRTDAVIIAVNSVIAADGIPGLTMRRIADEVRLSPSALHIHYGSRERMLGVIVFHTGRARRRQIEDRAWDEGVLAFLPSDDEDLIWARAWLAWCELGRSADYLAPTITGETVEELSLLAQILDHRFARPELEVLRAMIDGLLMAVCRPERPMSRERARAILSSTLDGLASIIPG